MILFVGIIRLRVITLSTISIPYVHSLTPLQIVSLEIKPLTVLNEENEITAVTGDCPNLATEYQECWLDLLADSLFRDLPDLLTRKELRKLLPRCLA